MDSVHCPELQITRKHDVSETEDGKRFSFRKRRVSIQNTAFLEVVYLPEL
jgi:hypothetical protein